VTRRIAAPDRRAERTRVRLEESLLDLLAERGYERTSVRALAARALVGKSTFYEHFRDKDAVLESRLARLARALGRATADAAFPFLEPLLEHVSAHRALASRLGKSSAGAIVLARFTRVVRAFVRSELERSYPNVPRQSLAFASEHVTGALTALLEARSSQASPPEPAELALDFRRLVLPGLDAWLRAVSTPR
jgi:AcrR family transcriptional regulator